VTARRVAALAAVVLSVAALVGATPARAASVPPIRHVFVLVLENEDYDATFGPDTKATYLAHELPAHGVLLRQYYGIGHVSLDNYLAMISGQAPNPLTQSDCQQFTDFVPSTPVIDGDGQAVGQGCVFPATVPNVADQLTAAGLSWGAYMDGMGTPCRHPDIGARDDTEDAEVGDQYATRHNPFMYFHSIIDDDATCRSHVLDLGSLPDALASATTTPNLSFVVPDLCNDGHDEPCVDGRPGGATSADAFLRAWVPRILDSPAFKADGMLVVTFDEAETGGGDESATACCGERPGPNSPMPGISGPGGGRIGAVVRSPYVAAGTRDVGYNHYSLLRTIEDIFGLGHLGFAAAPDLAPFGADVFAVAPPAATTSTAVTPETLPATGGGVGARDVLVLCGLGVAGLCVTRLAARRRAPRGPAWRR
jgi:hypothetical protein